MPPRAPALPPVQRRAALVAATLPLLREHGTGVSTREIARAAGVAEGTIFRVFDSKDELIQACVQTAFDTRQVVSDLRRVPVQDPLPQRLTAAVELLQGHLAGVFSLMMTLRSGGQHYEGPRPVHASAHHNRPDDQIEQAMLELIGPDADRLRVPPQRLLAFLRMLTLSSVHPMMADSAASAEEIVDVVLNGLLLNHQPRGT